MNPTEQPRPAKDHGKSAAEIQARIHDWKDSLGALRETVSFDTYLQRAIATPSIAALSHRRIYDMIMSHGRDDAGRYLFFKDHLFGLDDQIDDVVGYFRASAERLDTRKRILLLRGPVSSAKSTIVDLLKAGLEAYTRSEQGAVYGIEGCPMNEEPLHLIPPGMRKDIEREHGLYIEGELCPVCAWRLKNEHNGDFTKFSVRRVFFSEQDRVGIGTFLPSDPKSQDISELVGSINFSKIGELGVESHPEAFTFDGELNVSNRGMMEFIEMLKSDEKFLYVLLTLTQEQVIKAPRFPRIYADVCLVAHTNESEYNEFVGDSRSEALQDRIIVVDFPYNLAVDQEERIYHKLLAATATRKHIAPNALRVASMVAVLSRLEAVEDPKLDLVTKMRLYNGEKIGRYGPSDVDRIRHAAKREGMDGISPRYVTNRIASALIEEDVSCLTPERLLRLLHSGLRTHAKFSDAERERYAELIGLVHERYLDMAEDAVRSAVVVSMEDQCEAMFRAYLANVEGYVAGPSGVAAGKGAPDESTMRSVEKRMGVQESGKDSYRRQILAKVQTATGRGDVFDHNADDPLRHAIHDLIYEQNKNQVRAITSVQSPDATMRERIAETKARLIAQAGCCEFCADSLLQFVGAARADGEAKAREEGAAA